MSSLWEEYQRSSPVTKVVTIGLVVGIVLALCCVIGLAGFFLFGSPDQDDVAAQASPTITIITPVPPQTTPEPSPTVVFTDWRGEYYSNIALEGEPTVVRNDPRIDFNWGNGPPAPGVPPDNFSVRWTSTRDLPAGIYRINFRVDNGIRLWIDDTMIIDQWFESEIRTLSADVNLVAGTHDIRVEYFHPTGYSLIQGAAIYLETFPDWKAEYFNDPNLTGEPVIVRNEPAINYNWGSTSPIPGVVNDNFFSIRWTRTAHFDSDKYIFRLAVEGGARVWLDGQILIDSWDQTAFRELETTKDVSVGNHGLRVDYRKETGNGQIHFGWAELDNPGDPPLAVINGPVRAVVGQPVTFTARNSSVAEGHRLIGFEWNFGDGATGNGIDVTHVYNSAGKFTVSLTVIDDKGLRDTTEEEIEIIATPVTPQPDQPPVAIIIAPSKARVGDVVTFDASQSVCSNPCVSFAWDFGDGSKANAIKVQHVYRRTGDYNVILTLTDNKGLQGTSNTVVRIRDAAATATPIPPTDTPVAPTVTTTVVPEIQPDASFTINPNPALVGQQVTFDARSSDPGSSPITVYQWNFGDGSDPVETSNPVVTHNYNSPNDYTASLNVINAQGLQSNTSDGVTVLASVPPGDTPTPTTAPPVDTPTPIPPEEDTPTPIPPEEDTPTPIPPEEDTPTPIPPEEDTPTPIPPEEDTPTPIPPEEDTPTPEVEPPIAPTPTETPTEIPPDEHSGDINGDIEIE